MVDVGISCTGLKEIPDYPTRGKRESDADWAKREREWSTARDDAYQEWDELKSQREHELETFVGFYGAKILHLIDNGTITTAVLPDSFTARLRITGKGLKDLVLNYPYLFEVVEPETIELPQRGSDGQAPPADVPPRLPPNDDAPAVCVIDSGIQEAHVLLEPAVDQASSLCFLQGTAADDVADYVKPGGHGTRVAGALLYGEEIATGADFQLPFWIQNARVLDQDNRMPVELFPPEALRAVVRRFREGAKKTRIFNHSINATASCRTRYMSAWAAEIDLLSSSDDVLFVQSAGNLPLTGSHAQPGVKDHLQAGRNYPAYLLEKSVRIANPAQSLQALTVGSVGYGDFETEYWRTFGRTPGAPSAFTRTGFSLWDVIKPEVVEFGGDDVRAIANPELVQTGGKIPAACPELVRSTMHPPGKGHDRDETGTSFATPKVARIAALLQGVLPDEPTLLYRALIVQSARWPAWAEDVLSELRRPETNGDRERIRSCWMRHLGSSATSDTESQTRVELLPIQTSERP